ncbi:hypothetical protein PROFUN_11523 [Planoprotostelium fungivorum]|uniref:Uncharacterized protein n=1 Tax=Planoprotostelium fungivorum TaxID=1890364 RepID=A0A2P6NA04_9EUKA|nr:hypothetical protein PROFUN_11523 [Planoprotostelium fungivorum]
MATTLLDECHPDDKFRVERKEWKEGSDIRQEGRHPSNRMTFGKVGAADVANHTKRMERRNIMPRDSKA